MLQQTKGKINHWKQIAVQVLIGWINKFADVSPPLLHVVDSLCIQSLQTPVIQVSSQKYSVLAGICKKVFYLLPHA